jgi:hypothetical protein
MATDWCHCRSSAPNSTITTQPPDTKAAVSNTSRTVQLDGKHPMSSTRNMPSRSERHGDTVQISHPWSRPWIPEERQSPAQLEQPSRPWQSLEPHVATSNKRCSNPLAHLATGALQGPEAKLYPRPTSRTLPRLTLAEDQ